MAGHGWGRSQQGRERRAKADFGTRLNKWLEQVDRANQRHEVKEKNMADKLQGVSNSDFSETEKMVSIADDINTLSAHLGPRNTLDVKTALSCVELYKKTFGDEGYSYLEKKVDLFVDKYLFGKPEAEGIQQIGKLVNKLESLKTFQFRHYDDQEGYKVFVETEKKEIAASLNKSSLEKINEHFDKNATLEPDGKVRVKGFSELSHELNKGKPYFGSILEFTLKNDRFPTDAEIAKMPKQGETPPLERRNINSKEKNMSDQFEEVSEQVDDYLATLKGTQSLSSEEKELSPKEQAFIEAATNARFQRKVVADAIKTGTLSCLPGKDGYADTTPAVNIMTPNKPYHGESQLFLKAFQKLEQNGFPTAEYVTYHQIDKAREAGNDLYIMKGQKGVSIIIGEQKDTGEWENKNIRLFNVAQVNNPKLLKDWAAKEIENQEQKRIEYLQTQHGSGYKPPEAKPKVPGPEIVCSSTEPEKYLGQYLAAVSMGSKFKVNPEQAKEFSEKMTAAMYAPMEPRVNKETGEIKQPPINKETGKPITDPFALEKISIAANKECKEFLKEIRMQTQQQKQPEIKQEQTQDRGGFKM